MVVKQTLSQKVINMVAGLERKILRNIQGATQKFPKFECHEGIGFITD
jgi:hypothetical protein